MLTLTRINRSGITRTSRTAVTSGTAQRRLPAARHVAWLAAVSAVQSLAGCGSSGTSSTTPSTKSSSSPSPTPGSTVLAGASCKSSGATNITFLGLGARHRPGGQRVQQDPPVDLRHAR